MGTGLSDMRDNDLCQRSPQSGGAGYANGEKCGVLASCRACRTGLCYALVVNRNEILGSRSQKPTLATQDQPL